MLPTKGHNPKDRPDRKVGAAVAQLDGAWTVGDEAPVGPLKEFPLKDKSSL